MRRSRRGRYSEDPVDMEIQGHVTTARRALGRAVDACQRARRGESRHVNRRAYQDLMGILNMVEQVRSTVPTPIEDPDLYPESLRGQVADIEELVRRANRGMTAAGDLLVRAEGAFNDAGMMFAQDELSAIEAVEGELKGIVRALESYRGIRRGRIEREPIRRARQERRPATPEPEPVAPPVE